MSTEAKSGAAKDVYTVYQQSVDKFIGAVRQSVPKYHQSVTNAQQECVKACENVIGSSIALQKEFAVRAGVTTSVPSASLKMIHDATEEAIKAASVGNQIALAAIDAAQQNIKTFNDNSKAFADLNKNILQSWMSTFTAGR